jgi:VWFA-related protein
VRSVLLFALSAALVAQDTRFTARTRLVIVPVNVTDASGAAVPALEAADFTVLDEGRPQKFSVESIDTGVAPIALVVAVETAGISRAAVENIRRVGAMIQPLVTGERGCAGLLAFAGRLDWVEECTKDPDALAGAFKKLRVSEQQTKARLLDAASSAIEHLKRRENSRRVLLLISETRDRGSETKIEEVAAAAQAAGVSVYMLTYSAWSTAFTSKAPVGEQKPAPTPTTPSEAMGTYSGAPSTKFDPKVPPPEQRVDAIGAIRELSHISQPKVTDALTKATGGAIFSFTRLKGLEDAIRKFGEDLHSQYLLTFVPDTARPGYHAVEVKVKRPGLQVRARPGYRMVEDGK